MITGRSIESNNHIVCIGPGFAKDELDTACLPFFQMFVRELERQGAQVTIISLHYPYTGKEYSWNGIPVYPMNGKNKRLNRLFFLYSKVKKTFAKIHAKRKVDVIHAFWLNESTLFAQRLEDEFGVPSVGAAVGQDSKITNGYLKKIDPSKKITSSCTQQAEMLTKSGFIDVDVIPLGVDCEGKYDKRVDLIGVGNLIPLKNFEYFIEICAHLKEKKPNFTAVLVGSGTQKDLLKSQIEKYGLSPNVQLLGQLEYDKTLEYIGSARILIHPSTYEGFGMIIIEALALGTHVLASPVGIAKDLKEVSTLTFSKETDVEKVEDLLNAPEQISVVYSVKSTVKAFNKIYDSF